LTAAALVPVFVYAIGDGVGITIGDPACNAAIAWSALWSVIGRTDIGAFLLVLINGLCRSPASAG
jgi:hypothetical protein